MASIIDRRIHRRRFLQLTAYSSMAAYLAACGTTETSPSPSTAASGVPAASPGTSSGPTPDGLQLGPLGGPTLIEDPAQWPTTFNESPLLADLVDAGTLPPVEERVPQEPIVLRPLEAVGIFGGNITKAFTGPGDTSNFSRFGIGPDTLFYWDYAWQRLQPWIARSFEVSGDGTTMSVTLRQGLKWSDGEPVTADDIMFWYEDLFSNADLFGPPQSPMTLNGEVVQVRKTGDLSVDFVSPAANPLLPEALTNWQAVTSGQFTMGNRAGGLIAPKHYLQEFHAKFAGQEAVDAAASAAGFEGWVAHFLNRNNAFLNADLPVLAPWKTKKGNEANTQSHVLERNPYSAWVDTDGNQLPYIDTITHVLVENAEAMNLAALNGTYDFVDRYVDMNKLSEYLKPDVQERGRFKVHLDPSASIGLGVRINLSYNLDAEIGDLLRTTDFRRALSMGLDRDEINETFMLGLGRVGSYVPLEDNKYFPGEEAVTKWATHDVDQANQLLDGLGYTEKDGNGYRLRKDGSGRLTLGYLYNTQGTGVPAADFSELLKSQWQAIGIDLNIEGVATDLISQRLRAGDAQLHSTVVGTEELFLAPTFAFPSVAGPWGLGPSYATWFANGPDAEGAAEPFPELKELMELWRRGYAASEEERIRIGKEWWTKAGDLCLQIGLLGGGLLGYGFHIARDTMGNVPQRVVNSIIIGSPRQGAPQTFYYKA